MLSSMLLCGGKFHSRRVNATVLASARPQVYLPHATTSNHEHHCFGFRLRVSGIFLLVEKGSWRLIWDHNDDICERPYLLTFPQIYWESIFCSTTILVDSRGPQLIDPSSDIKLTGSEVCTDAHRVSDILHDIPKDFQSLFIEFPSLCKPFEEIDPATDRAEHRIINSGLLVTVQPHWLASDKLAFWKFEFNTSLANGIVRPSHGPWASPLHMVLKKDGVSWLPCGHYWALKAFTLFHIYSRSPKQDITDPL